MVVVNQVPSISMVNQQILENWDVPVQIGEMTNLIVVEKRVIERVHYIEDLILQKV